MNSNSIRKEFLQFFVKRDHRIVASAPLKCGDDDSLFFVNSGMVPFKDIFLGRRKPSVSRAVNSQLCLRVSGKHNDLGDVGYDGYHHTLFEMLGNWSLGSDYFKEETIAWAWELLTTVYGIPADRLYITYFGGDSTVGLAVDQESLKHWKSYLPDERIVGFGMRDNFWEMGVAGPCGPCCDIQIDLRSSTERRKIDGKFLLNKNHPEVIELWSLVFMQYERKNGGDLIPLAQRYVDTGIGLERLAMVLQNKVSTYDTDIFKPIIHSIENLTECKYSDGGLVTNGFRIMADHLRAVICAIAENIIPGNQKEGYVIRRISRRAIYAGYAYLQLKPPFLYAWVSYILYRLKKNFPYLKGEVGKIRAIIESEELRFVKTLSSGIKRLQYWLMQDKYNVKSKKKIISGEFSFLLYDTYGFPYNLTELIAKEKGYTLDKEGFNKLLSLQRERARRDKIKKYQDWVFVGNFPLINEFKGYDSSFLSTEVVAHRLVVEENKQYYQLICRETPFYPESGGQEGDRGLLITDGKEFIIKKTTKEQHLILHELDKLPNPLSGKVILKIDIAHRKGTTQHHSATHLLHAVLQEVLGKNILPKGSAVMNHKLRFDFSSTQKVDNSIIQNIEKRINEQIQKNIAIQEIRNISLSEAKSLGAKAFFQEKYGEKVRVIIIGDGYSSELCGGTHLGATGEMGYFKIIEMKSIGSGIIRIEAIVGMAVYDWLQNIYTGWENLTKEIGEQPLSVFRKLKKECKFLKKEKDFWLEREKAIFISKITNEVDLQKKYPFWIGKLYNHLKSKSQSIASHLTNIIKTEFIILWTPIENNNIYIVLASSKGIKKQKLLLQEILRLIDGKGGGKSKLSIAVGKNKYGESIVDELEKILQKFCR